MINNLVKQLLHKLGYTLIPNWRAEQYSQSEFIAKLFNHLKVDCVFDVGANEGQFCEFLRNQIGYKGLVVSFEPIPYCAKTLREKAKVDGNWIVEEVALGAEVGITSFNIMAGSQFSSFLNPDHSAVGRFVDHNKVSQIIEVEVRTLNEFVSKILSASGCSAPYLKLDTQGFDLNVIRGTGNQLQQFRALQTEASVVPIYKNMPSYQEVIMALQDMNFSLSGIFPNNPSHFPEMIEFDCHMVNKEFV